MCAGNGLWFDQKLLFLLITIIIIISLLLLLFFAFVFCFRFLQAENKNKKETEKNKSKLYIRFHKSIVNHEPDTKVYKKTRGRREKACSRSI